MGATSGEKPPCLFAMRSVAVFHVEQVPNPPAMFHVEHLAGGFVLTVLVKLGPAY